MECRPSENEAMIGFRINKDGDPSSPLSLPRLGQDNRINKRLPDMGNISSPKVRSDQEVQRRVTLDLASDLYLLLALSFVRSLCI